MTPGALFAGVLSACFVSIADVRQQGGALPAGSCGLAAAAFCETFDTPVPGGRGGDLDEARWNVARIGRNDPGHGLDGFWPSTSLAACGQTSKVGAEHDLVVCGGELAEALGSTGIAMRARQPIDLASATDAAPTILTFDVDLTNDSGSGSWIDVWIADEPLTFILDTFNDAAGIAPAPRSALGFSFFGCPTVPGRSELGTVYVSANGKVTSSKSPFLPPPADPCFNSAPGATNHVEIRIAPRSLDVWVSDAGERDTLRQIAHVAVDALPLSRGYVIFEHFAVTGAVVHHWDNIGFGGAVHPTPHAVDAPDSLTGGASDGVNVGYDVASPDKTQTVSLTFPAVDLTGARSAHLDFDVFSFDQSRTLRYCLNPPNGKCHELASPFPPSQFDAASVVARDLDLAELQPGTNQLGNLKMVTQNTPNDSVISNLTLTVEVE
jgi:hypothetical protein